MSVPPLPEGDLAWNYFPDNYRWSHGMLIALGGAPWGGAEIGEVHRVGLRLQSCVGDDLAWFRAWAHEADRLIEEAAADPGCSGSARLSEHIRLGTRFQVRPGELQGLLERHRSQILHFSGLCHPAVER